MILAAGIPAVGWNTIARGQVATWSANNAGDATGSWNVAGNWNPAAVPSGVGVVADFGTIDLSVNSVISLDNPAGFTVGGLTFGDVTASNDWTLQTGTGGTLTLATSTDTPTINVSNQTATITAVLTGTQGFTKTGAGTLLLAATNTFTGPVAINGGTLSITADTQLGPVPSTATPGSLVLNGGTLKLAGTLTLNANRGLSIGSSGGAIDTSSLAATVNPIIAGIIAGSGPLTLSAHGNTSDTGGGVGGNLALTGANTFVGDVTITSGVVTAASGFGDANNKIILSGGGLVATATIALPASRQIQLAAGGERYLRSYGSATFTINGIVSGGGNLRTIDSGTLVLGGANTYTGQTNVAGGTLVIGSGTSGSIATSSALSILGANTARVVRTDNVNSSTLLPSTITFAGTSSKLEFASSSQTSVLTLDQDIGSGTTVGWIRFSGGNATLASGTDLSANIVSLGLQNSANVGTLNIGAGSTITTPFFNIGEQGNNSGVVNQTGGLVTIATGGSGIRLGHWNNGTLPNNQYNLTGGLLDASLVTMNVGWDGGATMTVGGGSGTATLKAAAVQIDGNGDSTGFNDTLTLSTNGTIEVGGNVAGASVLDKFVFNGGTLKATANGTWSARFDVNAASTADIDGKTITFTGSLAGTAGLSINSTTAGGTFKVTTGTLGTNAISLGAGTTLNFENASAATFTNAIGGAGAVLKTGAGSLTLSGASTYTGTTTVNAGRLDVTGALSGSAVSIADGISIGGEGTVGALTLGATTGAALFVDPTTPAALTVTGLLTLNGTTPVNFTAPPTSTGPITVLKYGTLSGTASNLSFSNLSNYRSAGFTDTGSSIVLNLGNKNLTWTGSVGNTWDLGATANTNWTDGAPQNFFWGDNLTFNDTGSNTTIALAGGSLNPASITVNNTAKSYTLTASTGNVIGGTTALLKTGTGILTMAGSVANTFTGGTTISQGAINIQNAGSLGTGTITLGDANTGANAVGLFLDTNRTTLAITVVVANQGTAGSVFTLGSRSTVTGTGANNQFNAITLNRSVVFDSSAGDRTDYRAISGTGNITVTGSGRSVFSTANTWVGDLTITASGTLQLGTNSTAFDAIPNTNNVTVTSPGVLNLSWTAGGSETINGLSGNGTVGNNGGNANTLIIGGGGGGGTFSGLIRNGGATFSVTKTGAGTQILSNAANTYTGVTTVTGGILSVTTLANGGANSSIGASTNVAANVVLNGGTLQYTGGDVTIDRAFTIGTTAGSALDSSGTGALTVNSTNALVLTDPATRTATSAGTKVLTALSSTSDLAVGMAVTGSGIPTGATIASIDSTTQVTLNASANTTAGTGISLTFGGNRTLTLAGTSTAANTFTTVLANSANGGVTGLTKAGAGTWVVNGTNTYTGATTVSGGTLSVATLTNGGVASPIGQATSVNTNLVLAGGTLQYTGATATIDRPFTVSAAGGSVDIPTGTILTLNTNVGTIAANKPVLSGTLTKTGGGTLVLQTYSAGTATAATDLIVNQGTVTFGTGYFNASPFGYRALNINVNAGGTLVLNASHALGGDNTEASTSWGQIIITGGTLTTNGDNYFGGGTVNGLGRLVLNAGTVNGTGAVRSIDAGSIISTVAAANPSTISAGINVRGNVTLDVPRGTGSGSDLDITGVVSVGTTGGLIKSNTGIVTLTRVNTYTGQTQIQNGILRVNGSTSASSAVVVGNTVTGMSPTLAGTGTALGPVTLKGTVTSPTYLSPGHLAPGSGGVGTLTVASLTIESGAVLDYELNGTANDLTVVSTAGGLTIQGGGFNLYQEGTTLPYAFASPTTTHLIQYTGTDPDISTLSVLNPVGFISYSFQLASDQTGAVKYVDLVATPEPGTIAVVGVVAFGLLARRRRVR